MPVEVLVMCPSCARPQPPAVACAHCGATLPAAPERPAVQVPAAHEPSPASSSLPADVPAAAPTATTASAAPPPEITLALARGHLLVLGGDELELREGQGTRDRLPLADLRRVRLSGKRPLGKMLGAMIPLVLGLALVETVLFRVFFLVLLALTVGFYVRGRSWTLSFETLQGPTRQVPLGGRGLGGRGRVKGSVLQFVEALRRRGIEVEADDGGV